MPTRLADLSLEEKRELLARALKDKPLVAPLSLLQRRLWFLEQLEPGNPLYNTGKAIHIQGLIRIDVAEKALNEIIRRHESLRTTFRSHNGEPVQVVSQPYTLRMTLRDVGGSPTPQGDVVAKLVAEEIQRPFDLLNGPLLRVVLLRLSDEEHVAIMAMHHIISDGWSMGVLIHEFATLYKYFSEGTASPLTKLPIQYRDYARWQDQTLQGEELDRLANYWSGHLRGAPQVISLPCDRPRSSAMSFKGGLVHFALPHDLSGSLKTLARNQGTTLFTTLIAAFNLWLHRLTGLGDFLVGTPVAGRERPETQGLIGFLVNTLVLRADCSGNPSFLELLKRTRHEVLAAFEHQDLPFDKLVELLRPERNLGMNPIVQVLFALHNMPMPRVELSDLVITPMDVHNGISPFDLTVQVYDKPGGIEGTVEYKKDLFNDDTAHYLVRQFTALMESVATRPSTQIAGLSLLTNEERQRIVFGWNQTSKTFQQAHHVHRLFEEAAAQSPHATALIQGNRRMTYEELNRKANQVAHFLRRNGVGPEVVVGICAARSFDMVIGVLGVLKAGGAYLPLDPDYPYDRLVFMLNDARVRIVLAQSQIAQTVFRSDLAELNRMVVSLEDESLAKERDDNPKCNVHPQHLCYVIYTSGSTGTPKGVQVVHRGLTNLVLSQKDVYQIRPDDRVLQFFSFNFDAATSEIFLALTSGASLCLVEKDGLSSGEAIVDVLRAQKVTVSKFSPSFLSVVPDANLPSLRAIGSAGESLTGDLVLRWSEGRLFLNGYGPTETTIGAAMMDCTGIRSSHPPIGRPLPNVRIYILDGSLQPVPVGVTGELYIGGTGVSRGYLHLPALTAEKFLPDPFAENPGERMYRSGDLGRFLPDGTIEFVGRADNQVKIRGYRVEPEEIEHVLASDPGVRQAAVVVRKTATGEHQLIAYVVGHPDGNVTVDSLRSFVQRRLPAFMIPSAIVVMDAFPLTPNGKVDRAALPAPAPIQTHAEFIEPRTATEQSIAALWTDLLQVDKVGGYDDFFNLGGHSLLAMRFIAEAKRRYNVDIPVRIVFEERSVKGIAAYIDKHGTGESVSRIPRAPEGAAIPLSFSQAVLWTIDQSGYSYNTPVMTRIAGHLDLVLLERALTEIMRRHSILRATIVHEDGQPVHRIHAAEPVNIPVLDLSNMPERDREKEAQRALAGVAGTHLDPARGPLVRFMLVRLRPNEHIFFAGIHHLLFDGWSIGVFYHELALLYQAFQQGELSPLPEQEIQYTDYAYWQRHQARLEHSTAHREYWKNQLREPLPVLDLPADNTRSATLRVESRWHDFVVNAELLRGIKTLSTRNGATLFMTLLSAFEVLLHKYSGQTDLIVGTHSAHRILAETQPLIGFFAQFIPLRTDLSGDPAVASVLQRVRQTCLEAYGNLDVPPDRLTDIMHLFRDPSRMPVFQAFFALDEFPSQSITAGNITLTPEDFDTQVYSGFDITLALRERSSQLSGRMLYRSDLFNPETVKRMTEHFQRVLAFFVTNPTGKLSACTLLSPEEKEHLLRVGAGPYIDLPADGFVHTMVEQCAVRSPDGIALLYKDAQITYGELDRRANNLAAQLKVLGVSSERTVAVCVEPTPDAIIALLAVFKAGGVYLPVSPDLPPDRVNFMIADTGAGIVVTRKKHAAMFSAGTSTVVFMEELRNISESPRVSNHALNSHSAAYIIYTSGSTGTPKGVVVEHRSLLNLVLSFIATYAPTARDRVLQLAPTSFDASLAEILPILAVGGTLVIPGMEQARDADSLMSCIARNKITIFGAVPSLLASLKGRDIPDLSSVRLILSGAETLTYSTVDNLSPSAVVSNGYGPTETTVCSLYFIAQRDGAGRGSRATVPIGRPVMNTQAYVLDTHMNLVAVGVVGELYVGGIGLARGYMNRPDLTAQSFVPDPFSRKPGERLYKTGDLVRYLADGTIEFVGRRDYQTKLRGVRIELGEVETRVRDHPGVHNAAAIIHEDSPGDQRLVAYYTTTTGAPIADSDLRAFLQHILPRYMIPSHLIHVGEFPLTTSGKVDRKQLPPPVRHRPPLPQPYVEPRNVRETALASVWQDVLKVEQVGVLDDFFALGGHSLLAVQAVYRIQESVHRHIPVRMLFESPTVAQLAIRLEEMESQRTEYLRRPLLVPMTVTGTGKAAVCVHPAGGEVYSYRSLADELGRAFDVYGVQSPNHGDEPPSLDSMVAPYADTLLQSTAGPYRLVGHSSGGIIAVALADALERRGATVSHVVLIDTYPISEDKMALDHDSLADLLIALQTVFAKELGMLPFDFTQRVGEALKGVNDLRELREDEQLDRLVRVLDNPLIPSQVLRGHLRDILVRHKQHYALLRSYRLPRVQAALCVCRANETFPGMPGGSEVHWSQYTTGEVCSETFPANHYSILRAPAVTLLSDYLIELLKEHSTLT
jgi:amino acid adenylation domain-containing protein